MGWDVVEYETHDATGLAALVRTGQVAAAALVEAAIARIERDDAALNAVPHRYFADARARAAAGLPAGPFTGVPIVLKGTGAPMAGLAQSSGSALLRDAVAPGSSTLTERLLAAGFVPVGRTNVPEFALSFTTEPEAFGATRNPWDLRRSPGGSSGGSAAAVAAGMVPVAHAADGAGSIRVPAAHCGLFGFKPSRMRNPMGPQAAEGIAGLATPNAITRTVRDGAAMLDATSGPAVGDPYAAPPNARPFLEALAEPPRRLRIGLVTATPLGTPLHADCLAAAEAAAALCAGLGHDIEPAAYAYDAAGMERAWRVIAGVNLVRPMEELGRRQRMDPCSGLEAVNAEWLREGQACSGADYLAAVQCLHQVARAHGAFFAQYDILLSPATAEPAPLLGQLAGAGLGLDEFVRRFWAHSPFTGAFNASGCPAMTVPLGWTESGLPVGVQFGAGFGNDSLLFALAGELEAASPWAGRRPMVRG